MLCRTGEVALPPFPSFPLSCPHVLCNFAGVIPYLQSKLPPPPITTRQNSDILDKSLTVLLVAIAAHPRTFQKDCKKVVYGSLRRAQIMCELGCARVQLSCLGDTATTPALWLWPVWKFGQWAWGGLSLHRWQSQASTLAWCSSTTTAVTPSYLLPPSRFLCHPNPSKLPKSVDACCENFPLKARFSP